MVVATLQYSHEVHTHELYIPETRNYVLRPSPRPGIPGYDDLLKGGTDVCTIVAIADFGDTLGAICGEKLGAEGCDDYPGLRCITVPIPKLGTNTVCAVRRSSGLNNSSLKMHRHTSIHLNF